MKEQSKVAVIHVDDSKTPETDNRIKAWCTKNGSRYIRLYALQDLEVILKRKDLGRFVLVSDVRLGSYHVIAEFFAWLDEKDYEGIRKAMGKKMVGFLFYSGDYAHQKKSDMDYRINPAFLVKFLGGFHPDDIELIIKALDRLKGALGS